MIPSLSVCPGTGHSRQVSLQVSAISGLRTSATAYSKLAEDNALIMRKLEELRISSSASMSAGTSGVSTTIQMVWQP